MNVENIEINHSNRATKNRRRKSKVFFTYGTVALQSPIPTFMTGELQICSYRVMYFVTRVGAIGQVVLPNF